MSMLPIQRSTLNHYGDTETALKNFAQLTGKYEDDIKIGDLIAGNGLDDTIKNKIYTITKTVPAPIGGGAVVTYFPFIKAPTNGYITKAELLVYDDTVTWTAGTTTIEDYIIGIQTFYTPNSVSNFNSASLLTGVTNDTTIELPLSKAIPGLMTIGGTYAIAAVGASIVITASTSFLNRPQVGDILCMPSNAVNFVGTNLVNVGIYKVTAVTALTVSATKINATNPMSISATTAGSPEFYISAQNPGYRVLATEQIGVAIRVPVSPAVDISKVSLTFNFTLALDAV